MSAVLTNLGAVAVDTGSSPVVHRKISISFVTIPLAILSGGQTKAKVRTTTNLSPETRQHLKGLQTVQLSGKRLFVVDAFCGANPDTRLSVRFITEVARQAHFVKKHVYSPER